MKNILEKMKFTWIFWKKTQKTNFVIQLFFDLLLLYKSLIHWNISKLGIYFGSILLWLVLSLPFFIIYGFVWDLSFLEIYISLFSWISISSFDSFIINLVYIYKSLSYIVLLLFSLDFLNIIFLIWWILFLFSFFYSSFSLIKISNWYLKWEKISFKSLNFLNYKKIIRFFTLSFLNILILLIPVLLFVLLVWILFLFSWDLSELNAIVLASSKNYFSILSLVFLILCSILLIYTIYRIIFSYFILSEDDEFNKERWVVSYIKESFLLTKSYKLFFKFISVVLIFFVLILPFKYIWFLIMNSSEWITWYMITFSIFAFLFIYGVFIMMLTSFYKREVV
jgi:hypothetical protein